MFYDDGKMDIALAKESSQIVVMYSALDEGAPSRSCATYSMELDRLFPVTVTAICPTD